MYVRTCVRTYARSITWQPNEKRLTIFHEYGALSHARFARAGAPLQERSVFEACACLLLPEEMHGFVDMLQAKAWIIYMNTHFTSFVMYIWTWARKKISIFGPGNLNKSSWSSGMAERQVRQSYREALVQISPTTEKKKGKRKPRGIGESGRWMRGEKREWDG